VMTSSYVVLVDLQYCSMKTKLRNSVTQWTYKHVLVQDVVGP